MMIHDINWAESAALISLAALLITLVLKVIKAERIEGNIESLTKLCESQKILLESQGKLIETHAGALAGIPVMESRIALIEADNTRKNMIERSHTEQIGIFKQVIQLLLDSAIPAEIKQQADALLKRVITEEQRLTRSLTKFDNEQDYFAKLRAKAMPDDPRISL